MQGSCTGRAHGWARPGPQGGTGPALPARHVPPTPGSLQEPSGARFAVHASALQVSVLGVLDPYYPPGIPLPYTHPVPYPSQYTLPYMAVTAVPDGADSRFWRPVGEPRGVRTQPYSGSWTGYIQLFKILRFYTAV